MKESVRSSLQAAGNEPSDALVNALSGTTGRSSAGFPIVAEDAYQTFLGGVPFLFQDGHWLLGAFDRLQADCQDDPDVVASAKVLSTVIRTSIVTAPPDLWTLHHVWKAHRGLGIIDTLKDSSMPLADLATKLSLDVKSLTTDFHLLRARGYVVFEGDEVRYADVPQARDLVDGDQTPPLTFPSDLVPSIKSVLAGQAQSLDEKTVATFFGILPLPATYQSWIAGPYQMAIGRRLVALVLAMRSLDLTRKLSKDAYIVEHIPHLTDEMQSLLTAAGCCVDSKVTALGERAFQRGPGPYGIIHAYHPYMTHLKELLKGEVIQSWVARGENVAASQDANRKTFTMANDALDRFCKAYGYHYQVYVEHAVGQGEASRQRFERSGEGSLRYFGADLEDAAIDQAIAAQKRGELPRNMQFIRSADIGQPEIVVSALERAGFGGQPTVMVVGNGFHEVRHQTNEKMVDVLKAYREAGFLLIFTEESGLSDEDLLATGWNTYHAGFRYTHEISGQGLRPALDRDDDGAARYSWRKCANLAGYRVLEEFTTRTRRIFPHPRKDGYNPAISVNYFCIPESLAAELGVTES